jgi:GTP-binding protein
VKIHRADYVISAPSLKHCPDFEGVAEIVLVGRSNVGKSSFINSLTQRKNLARTSNTPGKTRHINFYDIEASETALDAEPVRVILVDLPGYGYARISKSEQEKWRKNLEAYLSKREAIRLIVQLIDSRHGPQANDIQMAEWLAYHQKPTQVILTKADKISRNELAKQVVQTSKTLGIPAPQILTYSAETHAGRDEAWRRLL